MQAEMPSKERAMMSEHKTKTEIFEEAAATGGSQKFILTLFVAGMTPRSLRAIENARQLCEKYLKDRCELEVIDVYQQPGLAKDAQVIAAPTLVKHLPPPLQRFIGDLSDPEPILVRLAIKAEEESS
jgi:circadian clock protein KaiB